MTGSLEERRLALEERKLANEHDARMRELDLKTHDGRNKLSAAWISILSAVVGAVASLGAALVSGVVSIQGKTLDNRAEASLEQQKFDYELIRLALSEPDLAERAARLAFMSEIGLLKSIDTDKVRGFTTSAQQVAKKTTSSEPTTPAIPYFELSSSSELLADPDLSKAVNSDVVLRELTKLSEQKAPQTRIVKIPAVPAPSRAEIDEKLIELTGCDPSPASPGSLVPDPSDPCLRAFMGDAFDASAAKLLRGPAAPLLMEWLESGRFPATWRDQLDRAIAIRG
ncbi:MAG: hypothetical protein ACPGNV_04780 [Mangrovicoccus sp.]